MSDSNSAESPDWIICEDGPLVAVNKPTGIFTEGFGDTVVDRVKSFLKSKYQKSGNVYLGIPHRLDRETTGVMVFARNSKAAARLAEQFSDRSTQKTYLLLLEKPPQPNRGELVDWLLKDSEQAFVEVVSPDTPKAREARLSYETLHVQDGIALVRVELHTGRTHQIRVQFASRGCPVLGDVKYGGSTWQPDPAASQTDRVTPNDAVGLVALHALSLRLKHPIRYDEVLIEAPLPNSWPAWACEFIANLGSTG